MDLDELCRYLNQSVRLSFTDGEIVDATLHGVDPIDRVLTYTVLAVLAIGLPLPRGTAVGVTCVANADHLIACEPISKAAV
jgi:hypothetical protein